jgi:hypothetical protein
MGVITWEQPCEVSHNLKVERFCLSLLYKSNKFVSGQAWLTRSKLSCLAAQSLSMMANVVCDEAANKVVTMVITVLIAQCQRLINFLTSCFKDFW